MDENSLSIEAAIYIQWCRNECQSGICANIKPTYDVPSTPRFGDTTIWVLVNPDASRVFKLQARSYEALIFMSSFHIHSISLTGSWLAVMYLTLHITSKILIRNLFFFFFFFCFYTFLDSLEIFGLLPLFTLSMNLWKSFYAIHISSSSIMYSWYRLIGLRGIALVFVEVQDLFDSARGKQWES